MDTQRPPASAPTREPPLPAPPTFRPEPFARATHFTPEVVAAMCEDIASGLDTHAAAAIRGIPQAAVDRLIKVAADELRAREREAHATIAALEADNNTLAPTTPAEAAAMGDVAAPPVAAQPVAPAASPPVAALAIRPNTTRTLAGYYAAIYTAFQAASARFKAKMIGHVVGAAPQDWRAAYALLEAYWPDTFSARVRAATVEQVRREAQANVSVRVQVGALQAVLDASRPDDVAEAAWARIKRDQIDGHAPYESEPAHNGARPTPGQEALRVLDAASG